MKLILRIILIGAITYFLSALTFWWIGMLAAFIVCFLLPASGLIAFISGFLGAGLVWMGHAWTLDVANEGRFSSMIIELFPLNDPFMLIVASGLIGGLSAGFAAISGTSFRKLFLKEKQRGVYS